MRHLSPFLALTPGQLTIKKLLMPGEGARRYIWAPLELTGALQTLKVTQSGNPVFVVPLLQSEDFRLPAGRNAQTACSALLQL